MAIQTGTATGLTTYLDKRRQSSSDYQPGIVKVPSGPTKAHLAWTGELYENVETNLGQQARLPSTQSLLISGKLGETGVCLLFGIESNATSDSELGLNLLYASDDWHAFSMSRHGSYTPVANSISDLHLNERLYVQCPVVESPSLPQLRKLKPQVASRIDELSALVQGWDGYGGDPVTPRAVSSLSALLLAIHAITEGQMEDPSISPLPEGGLELEWELDSGVELMIVIPPKGEGFKYLLDQFTDGGEQFESEGDIPETSSLTELLHRALFTRVD